MQQFVTASEGGTTCGFARGFRTFESKSRQSQLENALLWAQTISKNTGKLWCVCSHGLLVDEWGRAVQRIMHSYHSRFLPAPPAVLTRLSAPSPGNRSDLDKVLDSVLDLVQDQNMFCGNHGICFEMDPRAIVA